MRDVNSFTDRKGNKVRIGDNVGYFRNEDDKPLAVGEVDRIRKSGYFMEIFIKGNKHPWHKPWIEKI